MVKAAVEKDWGAEVPPAFKIMYPRPAPTRAVQPPLNISQCVAALAAPSPSELVPIRRSDV